MLVAVLAASGRTIDIDIINCVLMQPHWQHKVELEDLWSMLEAQDSRLKAPQLSPSPRSRGEGPGARGQGNECQC